MAQKIKHSFIKLAYITIDFFLIYFAIFIAHALMQAKLPFAISFRGILVDQSNPYRFVLLAWVITTILFISANRLYQTRREVFEGFEIWLVIKSVFFSALLTIVGIYALKLHDFPRTVFFVSVVAMVFFLSLWRVIKRFLVEYLVAHGYNNFYILIIGAGKVGQALAGEIMRRPGLGMQVVGFLDDFKTNVGNQGVKILGKISDFTVVAQRQFIDKVFVTIYYDQNAFTKLLEEAKELNVAVRVVPQGFDLISGGFEKYNIGLIPILEYSNIKTGNRQTGKRLFDCVVSLAALMALAPFLAVLAMMIKMGSKGPVFYISRRYGKGGRVFNMYKFRSMVKDADKIMDQVRGKNEVDGPIFKIKQDPRVTKAGSFLRKYSLDELPQLINVLKGEMSLVGPRPLPIEQIEKEDLRQLKRLEVKPGMTGLWQIRGRSDLPFARLVKWDIWYINNWSFWLDINILFQTIPTVLKGKGAY